MISNYSIGLKLYEIRKCLGLSQEQVALEANITTSYYGQIEREERNITVKTLEKICSALNISLTDFFNGFDKKNNADTDEIINQIMYQLNGKTSAEKQAVLKMIKLVFAVQKMK